MHDAGGQIRNPQHVLVRFRGQTQHKIQLHGVIAACKRRAAGCQQLLLGHVFIDNIPQALGAGLRRKGQAGLAPLGQPLHKAHGKIIRPQAGERQIHMALPAKLLQIVAQLRELRIIAGAEGRQRHLLVAGVVAGLHAVTHAQLLAAVADGAVHIAGLTESAAPNAAPKQLQRHPILHDLRGGNDGLGGVIGLVHILHDALAHDFGRTALRANLPNGAVFVVVHLIQAGHIQPRHLRRSVKELCFTPPFFSGFSVQLDQLHRHVLALTQADDVHKVGNRLGVVHRCAAGDDQRRQAGAFCAVQRDAR